MYSLSEISSLLNEYYLGSEITEKLIDDIVHDLRMSRKVIDHSEAEAIINSKWKAGLLI